MTKDELTSLVREYDRYSRNSLIEALDSYSGLPSEVALRYFALAEHIPVAPGRKGKRWSHQRRIRKVVLSEMEKRFQRHKKELLAAEDFDGVYNLIKSIRVTGYGATCIYDAALAIGWWREPKVLPEKIYLHTGPLIGARNLGLNVTHHQIERSCLPPPLRKLKPFDVEHFLCIYASVLDKYEAG